jgi:glycosyltransferase involved in cell wall biosynthesis
VRVLHFILGKANKARANGVNQVIAGLAKYSARLGAEVRVLGMAETVQEQGEVVPRDGFSVTAYSRPTSGFFAELRRSIAWSEVVHLHGVFSPWNLVVARECRKLERPYVVTLHDGLARERLLARGQLRKKAFHWIAQRRHLASAAGIHVLTEEEGTEAQEWFSPRRLFCVPNGIDLEDFPRPPERRAASAGEVVVGYVGRLSPEKNLESLCSAVATLRASRPIRLELVGPDSPYARELRKEFADRGTSWLGPKYGDEKVDFLASLDLFAHPSLCDVFSIAAMEVMAVGTPLLITRTAKASYFFDRGAFFMCEPTAFGLERGLRQAMERRSDWPEISRRGRKLVEERLNWAVAAREILSEYDAVIGASAR